MAQQSSHGWLEAWPLAVAGMLQLTSRVVAPAPHADEAGALRDEPFSLPLASLHALNQDQLMYHQNRPTEPDHTRSM
jgi:hypothetical protein